MPLAILGIGTAVPERAVNQRRAAELAKSFCRPLDSSRDVLAELYRRSGVETRHAVVLDEGNGEVAAPAFYPPASSDEDGGPTTARRMERYETEAAPLAVAAAHRALRQADVSPAEITHLVTVSCSGFSAPGFDVALIDELGLSVHVSRTHIGFMGCHAALNALRVAQGFAEAQPEACILVCCVELCSLHQQYGRQRDRLVANALFADGAAALVGRSARPDADSQWVLTRTGSALIPNSRRLMQWRIRDHGFEMTLSPEVPAAIGQHLRPWLQIWLSANDLATADIGSWAIHPGGPRILSACAECLPIDQQLLEPSREVLARFGNMSSPTILFILKRLQEARAARPCVMLAFGPGLTVEAGLVW